MLCADEVFFVKVKGMTEFQGLVYYGKDLVDAVLVLEKLTIGNISFLHSRRLL